MIVGLRAGDPRSVGPYQLLGRLGCGGMGSVFLGREGDDGSLVAVKVIRADLAGDPGFRARFGQEVAAAGRVSGQFTAALADADTTGPVPWLATSYVPGPSLAELVRMHGALPPSSVLVLGAGLAEALAEIHAADLVHRDLKPSNVLVAVDGPRVIDFGISRAAGATSLTLAGMVMGSPGFMSPEQAEGGPVGPASDVFSLGTLLTFAATGQGPFGAGSMAALLYRVVYGEPCTEALPRQLRPLVDRCLAKDPGRRPTPDELRAELGPVPAADWLPAPVTGTLSRFAAPEAALAEAALAGAVQAGAVQAGAVQAGAVQAEAALARAGWGHAAAALPGWDAPDDQPTPAWLPMTGGQLPVSAGSGPAGSGPADCAAASHNAGIGGEVSETGMKLAVVGGELPGPGHQPAGTDEEPTVTAARPRLLRNVPRPRAVAVAPPRHPGRRRRSRVWAAAGAGTGAAGVLVAVMLTGALQPVAPPPAHPARVAAKLPDPSAVWKARGAHRPTKHQHRAGSGITMAVAASSSPSPGSTQPAVAPGSAHPASPTSSPSPTTPASHPARTYTQAVPGSQEWTDTGIAVQAGDQLTISASGEIYVGATSASEGPAGISGCTPAVTYPAQSAQFPVPSLTCWSLIARIGGGAPFEVGGGTEVTATSGDLYLGINGDSFTGNSGSWSATITVRSPAA